LRLKIPLARRILSRIPYERIKRSEVKLPKRSTEHRYDDQASLQGRSFIAERY
jgi:polyphosphate kinase